MWFISALVATLSWGTADLFYKIGNNERDRYSAAKTVVMVGLVMGLHVFVYYFMVKGVRYDWHNLIVYLPVSAMYILSMTLGYVGLRYIELSIASPISNSSGAVSALMTYFFLNGSMSPVQFAAVGVISAGIVLLSLFEKQEADKELTAADKVHYKKYRLSAIAIVFPILYCIIDGVGTFLDGYYLEYRQLLSEDQGNISYELTFLMVGLLVWLYLAVVKKERIRIFSERAKGLAACFETFGQFFYVGAIATNAIVVAPMISSYSIVSVILSRIFLKEKLSVKQYLVVAAIIIAIAVLGFYDG